MKKISVIFALACAALILLTGSVQANDYLEVQKHYMLYTSGSNKIHFKIPVWAYGKGFNYYLDNSSASYIVQTKNASGKTVESDSMTICMFKSEPYGENANEDTQRGTAWLKVCAGQGVAVITSMYNGTALTVNDSGDMQYAMVRQQEDDDCPHVTMLEFDWYPPESLNEKSIIIALNIKIYKSYTENLNYEKYFRFNGPFSGSNNLMSPQLSEPYLYTVNATGVTGYGQAAVQYTTFQQPLWYTAGTSTRDTVRISDRSGTIYINTTDTVQEQFTATFGVYRDEVVQTVTTLTAPPVDIPPFHRIHHFRATEEQDSLGSLTGSNILRWEILNPELKDLVDNDYFEIQRATRSDYSDAHTIHVMNMRRSTDGEYSYVDAGYLRQADSRSDTVRRHLSAETRGYILRDAHGNPMCELDLELESREFMLPSAPVYYRIRRAASSLWGWEHDFARCDTLDTHNYLAPLSIMQSDYRKDDRYPDNHTVHFDIKLDNMEIGYRPVSLDNCQLTVNRRRTMGDTVEYAYKYNDMAVTSAGYDYDEEPVTIFVYVNHDGDELFGPMPGRQMTSYNERIRIPRGSMVTTTFRPLDHIHSHYDTVYTRTFSDHTRYTYRFRLNNGRLQLYALSDNAYAYYPDGLMPEELARIREISPTIKMAALPALMARNESYGRCIWDRTARLLLCRTNQATGQTVEIIVPQDSIQRQPDGSWRAHMTDVAGEPCTHYSYAVRIDQSDASIHVSDDSYLQPVPVYGPSLYFDEAAAITSFTATQGEAQGSLKNGIRLAWTASSDAVDEYVLTRIRKHSDQIPDTILRTVDNNHFDESALPGVQYEYTLTALYACNGKTTASSATTDGWRTPYGLISGQVLMPDNCGMSGVQVSLSEGGQTLRTVTTGATGAFVFDSLEYNISSGTVYTVTPTSQYGTFSYNSTSSAAASVTLSPDRAVVSGIGFVNTSAVRITGRILYKHSTIPAAGVTFLLNGDTVRRNGSPLLSDNDGSFELSVPKSQMLTLQVCKAGHTFEGDGILRPESGSDRFSLVKPLDGVRFYDLTKVRLVGRVAGGADQQALQHGFGLGRNNLGDDLQLVLQLEGDNTAHIVHDPDDLTRDTLQYTIGQTNTIYEQKRIIIRPDITTGEYAADLFPVKYKVVQATAKGYATLFPSGVGSETFDLSNAPLTVITDSLVSGSGQTSYVRYNAVYDRIYHNPVQVSLVQLNYGMEADGMGEAQMKVSELNPLKETVVPMYTKQPDGTVEYLLGYPVFMYNRRYQFVASAYEEYLYNNEPSGAPDRVPQRGGSVTIQNGMSKAVTRQIYPLDNSGRNKGIWLTVDDIDLQSTELDALRTVSVSLESEGNTVEAVAFRAFVEGTLIQPEALQSTEADLTLLDIVRDPGGSGSSAYLESGTTFKFAYTESYHWKLGMTFTPSWSSGITQDIGMVSAPAGAGTYIGATYSTNRELSFSIPIVHEWKWGYKYDYTFTTTDRISTSSSKGALGVGSNADVFIGATTSQLAGKAKSVALISDSLYEARRPAIEAGVMKVLQQGADSAGNGYYLVTGEKVVLGSYIGNTFVYSQAYILKTLIPMYIMQRENLLMNFADEEEAQAVADASGEPVYWNLRTASANRIDTLDTEDYMMIVPNDGKAYIDRVKALDNMIWKWTTLVYTNEKEKVMARTSGLGIGTFSVNYGNTYTHSDSYSAMSNYNEMPQGKDLLLSEVKIIGAEAMNGLLNSLTDVSSNFLKGFKAEELGKSVADAVKDYYKYENGINLGKKEDSKLGTKTNSSEFHMYYSPVFSFDCDDNLAVEHTEKKTAGFTLVSDELGDITVSVYRANLDSVWKNYSASIRNNTNAGNDLLYGSYVFFTQSGSTFCPYEPEERTVLYNAGTLLNRATERVAKPEMSVNTYELTNIPSDQRATFCIELKNGGEVETGPAASGQQFSLALVSASNPDGAKVFLNGAALATPVNYFIMPGQTVVQTIEIEKGQVDDYENLQLIFGVTDCPKTYTTINLSVHFMPESSPVNIVSPRDRWVMNTLSAKDSIGYYLPVTIDGFDVHHKNFDHIEFQYKLSTENDDAWVNLCSFYADDSLYHRSTGSKAMIENGRIMPFRFYGERDPKELEYDLRAVSFCRYGSGFVSKSSPVVSGTKDTRVPVLFGKAQPANGILTLEDNISLRFSEPIAGNRLDADNHFQLLGVTNATGITQSTSLHFDGTAGHMAATVAERELAITDLTVDMMIRPSVTGKEMALLSHGDEAYSFTFSLTADNRLKLTAIDDGNIREVKLSKPMAELSTVDFTRVIMVYNFAKQTVRFYAGTLDITDDAGSYWLLQNSASCYRVGAAPDSTLLYQGNMMELRIWTKPLTPDEIAGTHMRRLTGYEHSLMDYYPMNEGKGNELTDLASGATLYTGGLTWTNPQGMSLALDGGALCLQPEYFSRTAAQDYTFTGWYRSDNASDDAFTLLSTSQGDSLTMSLEYAAGRLIFRQGEVEQGSAAGLTDGQWHHIALTVSKSYNTGALYLDGAMVQTFTVATLAGLNGSTVSAGKGLKGNIDDICLFEQALPAALVQEVMRATPNGDEMGLIALLTFSEIRRNDNNIPELVFSPNDQRVFRDANGNVVNKVVPLIVGMSPDGGSDMSSYADRSRYAPVADRGQLTNLNFTFTYHDEEMLISLNMQEREINKRTIYLTVRDVEDLNGNRLPSPVSWSVYADLNSLRWETRKVQEEITDTENDHTFRTAIYNTTGVTRQYTVDNLPEWLDALPKQGTLTAKEETPITFTVKKGLTPGRHNAVVYLTDDRGLTESLVIDVNVVSECPWDNINPANYKHNMALRAQVIIDSHGTETIDTDGEDIVGIFCNGEMIGKGQVHADADARGYVYITVYGDASLNGRLLTARLWRHATAKTHVLLADTTLRFRENSCLGCPPAQPVRLRTSDAMMQTIGLEAGWTWTSFCIKPDRNGIINDVLISESAFDDNDEIKSPATGNFCRYNDLTSQWRGPLTQFNYRYIHMFYTRRAHTITVSGTTLQNAEERTVTLRHGWNVLPYLSLDNRNLREAMAEYYTYAQEGDMVKSHDEFAVFSADGKWEGNLTYMQPGRGYMLYRQAESSVTFTYPPSAEADAVRRDALAAPVPTAGFRNPDAATNMTMIAMLQTGQPYTADSSMPAVKVYLGDELVGEAAPVDSLYFLTIQSDAAGSLSFCTADGTTLTVHTAPGRQAVHYLPDAHHGTLRRPVILTPVRPDSVYKRIENEHVIIIRNGERYDVTGVRMK